MQHSRGKGNSLALEAAVEGDAASSASDDEHPGRSAGRLQLQAAKIRVVAAADGVIQLQDIPAGEDLLRRTTALDGVVVDAGHTVGDFLRQVQLVEGHQNRQAPAAHHVL